MSDMQQRTDEGGTPGPKTVTEVGPYDVRIIANPQAGKDEPFFGPLAAAFGDADIRWNIDVTNGPGEDAVLARRAVEEGARVVVAFGGDGTVSAVADAVAGTDAVLGILPGGTGNVFARELGIPMDLEGAAKLLAGPHEVRDVDLGTATSDDGTQRTFILRVAVGLEAVSVEDAPREAKEKMGDLAYILAGLRSIQQNPTVGNYRLEDGEGNVAETQGIFAVLSNSGHVGVGEARYAPDIRIDDGLIDGIIGPAAPAELIPAAAAALSGGQHEAVERLTSTRLRLVCDPPQHVTVDGESMGETPVTAEVRPHAVRVIAPVPQADDAASASEANKE